MDEPQEARCIVIGCYEKSIINILVYKCLNDDTYSYVIIKQSIINMLVYSYHNDNQTYVILMMIVVSYEGCITLYTIRPILIYRYSFICNNMEVISKSPFG